MWHYQVYTIVNEALRGKTPPDTVRAYVTVLNRPGGVLKLLDLDKKGPGLEGLNETHKENKKKSKS